MFIDPKGTSRSEYEHEVDGYRVLFEENGQPRIFPYQGLKVSVHLFLYTPDREFLDQGYKRYWLDQCEIMIESLLLPK